MDLRATVVGTAFDDPPRDHTDVVVYGEIVGATGFDTTSLYIEFDLIRPESWRWRGPQADAEAGVTQVRPCDAL
jgi:hypothetical protein